MIWGDLKNFTWGELRCFTWKELENLQTLDLLIKAKNSPDIPAEVAQKLENLVASKLKLAGLDLSSSKTKFPKLEKSASIIDWVLRIKGFADLSEWITPAIQDVIEFLIQHFNSL
ncbi:hypothetical protein [Bacteroides heparinolyticus]|uniref:hypothetical protein n=1 Tax=Prevotella heparinolytica TaxID=28113 RepID=UPI00359FEEFD